MTNILEAIINISKLENLDIDEVILGNNRAVNMGEGLESFVKKAFANSFGITDKNEKNRIYNHFFSYEGSKRIPPDLMIKGGDALEVKKTETLSTELQLNSSHPKAKLFANSTLINNHCRTCEEWETKDFIYVIGHLPKSNYLSSLWFVHGEIYAADESVYIDLKNSVSELLQSSDDRSEEHTSELQSRPHLVCRLRLEKKIHRRPRSGLRRGRRRHAVLSRRRGLSDFRFLDSICHGRD